MQHEDEECQRHQTMPVIAAADDFEGEEMRHVIDVQELLAEAEDEQDGSLDEQGQNE